MQLRNVPAKRPDSILLYGFGLALALSLVKRLADLLVGVPGLFAWHALEGTQAVEPVTVEARSEPTLRHDLLVPVLANDFGTRARADSDLGDLKKCA